MGTPTAAELEAFRAQVQQFVAEHVTPHAEEWTSKRTVSRELHLAAGRAGLLGLKYSAELGGTARSYAFTEVMLREFGGSGQMGCLASLVVQSEFSTPHINLYGSPSLKERLLVPAIRGEKIISIAMTEPEGGSNLAELKTVARRVPGGFRIDGRKWMIGNASLADVVLVVCNDPEGEEGWATLTLVAVEAGTKGFSVVRQLEKIGLHATPNCELSFENCVVPEQNVVGKPGVAGPQLLNGNVYERVGIALLATGAMRAAWELALRYLSERQSGGKALLDHSPWRHQLMEDFFAIEGCDRVVRDAALSLEAGTPDQSLALMAKIMATETCRRVVERSAQAHGARGYLQETPIGRMAADAPALTVAGGGSEVLTHALSTLIFRKVLRGR